MDTPKKIGIFADAATIVATLLLSVVLVKVYLLPAGPTARVGQAAAATVKVGEKLKLSDVNWRSNGQTLLLAISSQCHFCKESMPFYKKLQLAAGRNVRILALMPQPVTEAEQYLNSEGVHIDQIKQLSLRTIGVEGTPTLLLVDGAGIVKKVWTGKLDDTEQEQVLTILKKG